MTDLSLVPASSSAGPSGGGADAGPEVAHFALANGLEVVVIPDHRAPVVTHMVWYRNGSADDPVGKSGIAHFLEHLMFKGTEAHPAGAFSEVVAELGGQENAFTSMDYTAYYQRIAAEHLGTVMGFEADRMTGLALDDAVVAPERDVVLEERRMRTDSDPGAQLSEALSRALFTHHPYGLPIIGWMHEIEELDRADALAYYSRFYTPENAILVVAGDVKPDAVRSLAEETYGRIPARAGAAPVRRRPREPQARADRRVTLRDPKVEQPSLQRAMIVPSYRTGKPGEAEALDLLSQLLGAPQTGHLYKRLVMEEGVAVNAGVWYMGSAIDDTRFALYAVPVPGISLPDLEARLDAALAAFAAAGPGEAELRRAKTRLVADAVYAQDNQANMARIYGSTLAIGGSIEDVRAWPGRIEAVTAGEVREAARRLIGARGVTGYLEKDETAPVEVVAEAA